MKGDLREPRASPTLMTAYPRVDEPSREPVTRHRLHMLHSWAGARTDGLDSRFPGEVPIRYRLSPQSNPSLRTDKRITLNVRHPLSLPPRKFHHTEETFDFDRAGTRSPSCVTGLATGFFLDFTGTSEGQPCGHLLCAAHHDAKVVEVEEGGLSSPCAFFERKGRGIWFRPKTNVSSVIFSPKYTPR